MKSHGFTLLEALVSLSLLTAGVTGLWWALQRGLEAEQRLRWRHMAQALLVSEAEKLRGRPAEFLRDTAYAVPVAGERTLRLRRTVLDSLRREALLDPSLWEETLRQAWRQRPLEVVLEAWPDSAGLNPEAAVTLEAEGEGAGSRPLARLFLVLPDYQWY